MTHFIDGSLEEYNTESHFCSANLFQSNGVGAVTFVLDVDDLEDGLFVQLYRHDFGSARKISDGPSGGERMTRGEYFGDDAVLDCDALERAVQVVVDGTIALLRINADGKLIVWSRFTRLCDLYLGSDVGGPWTEKAALLYYTLKGRMGAARMPRLEGEDDLQWDARIAERIGWDVVELMECVALYDEARAAAADDDPSYDEEAPGDFQDMR